MTRRGQRRHRRGQRPGALGRRTGAAAALVPLVLLALVAGCGASSGDDVGRKPTADQRPAPTGSATRSATSSPTTYLGLPVEPAASAHVLADHTAGGMLLAQPAANRLWVGGAEGLWWVDPADESVHQVDAKPGVGVFLRGDTLYRAAYYAGDVARYDVSGPKPGEAARVRAPSPLYGVVTDGWVWVTDHVGGRLLQLDPVTLARRATLQLGPRTGGYHHALAGLTVLGPHRLWVVSERDQRLYEVDTRTAKVVDHVQLDDRPTDQVFADGRRLWVMLSRGENAEHADLELVDTAGHQVLARVVAHDDAFLTPDTQESLGSWPVVVDGEVWVPADEHLVHLDPVTGWKADRVLALPVPGMFARFATVAFGSLWVYSDLPQPTIVRVPLADLT